MSSDPSAEQQVLSDTPQQQTQAEAGSDSLADDIRKQVENEQALADAQSKLRQLEAEVLKLAQEKQAIQNEKEGASSNTDQLQSQLSTLQSSYHKATSELSVLQTRLDSIEREKRELVEETERLQQRSVRTTQELYTLRSNRTETSQKIAHLDVEVSELRMAAESAKFNESRSVQALKNARTEILTVSKSAAEVEERFGRYRAEKQSEISQLQTEHDLVIARLTAVENTHHALQRTYNEQSRRLADAHASIATLTSAAAAKKASTASEFSRLMEENRILEKRGDEARAQITERESELERLVSAQESKEKSWEERWKKEERLRREAEKRSEDLKIVVERLSMAQGIGSDISPAAALAADQKMNGKSYTQFYVDYTVQESKLRAAENEVDRLTSLLDEISADIAEKKPLLDEQAAEHSAAIERANALAAEAAAAMAKRDQYELEVKSLRASSNKSNADVQALQTTADDLSRQVQGLLRHVAILNNPSLADESIDANANAATGDIISDHLVEFRSIRALQEQNQKLLKLTRALKTKLDDHEVSRASNDASDVNTGATLDQATETITRLHTQLLDAQKKISEVTRERDTFSKLLARGEGLKRPTHSLGASNGTLDESAGQQQAMIDAIKEEMDSVRAKSEQDVLEAKKELRLKAEEAGQAEVAKARAEAQVNLLQEQHRMLSDASNLQKQEYNHLETQLRQVQASISQANNERRSALESAASRQAEADRIRNEAASLRAEKDQWKSTESRLQTDFQAVQAERARLQHLIDGLNNVTAENERTRTDERVRLEKRIEELQREATALRSQLEEAKEATRAAEKRSENLDSRVENATIAIRGEKLAAEALVSSRAQEITKLQGELEDVKAESERRLRVGLKYQTRAREIEGEKVKVEESLAAKDTESKDIQTKLDGIAKELKETKVKLSEAEKKVTEAEKNSQESSSTIARLQGEIRTQSQATATTTSSDSTDLASLQTERDSLTQKVADLEKALEEAKTNTTTSSAPSDDSAHKELEAKFDALVKEKDDLQKRYDTGVIQVNRVNRQGQDRIAALLNEKAVLEARATELEKQISDLKTSADAKTDALPINSSSQEVIDKAVKEAVAARESELQAEHSKALEEAKTATQPSVKIEETSESTLDTRRAELEAGFESRLKDAISAKEAEWEKEKLALQGEVEELKQKIKTLERQMKTAEITRKTLERQKTDAEYKLKRFEDGQAAETPSAETVPAADASSTAPSTTDTTEDPAPTIAAEDGSTTALTTPATTGVTRGSSALRARGRGVALRGRSAALGGRTNSVLNAVNQTLQASSAVAASASTSNKRPLQEDGEISEAPTEKPAAPPTSAPRILKRPRGAAPRIGTRSGAPSSPSAAGDAQQNNSAGGSGDSPAPGGEGGST